MASLRLSRHATLGTTCLLQQRSRPLLVRGSFGAAAATPLLAAAASADLPCSQYSSMAASPSPRVSSSSSSPRRSANGLVALTVTASAVAVSVCVIFFYAIRSMLTCKREAELLEKYLDSARKKLPGSMASVRLVGREVSDLAADLCDLSQELRKGVKSSMSIVHTAESQLRQDTPSALPGSAQRTSNQSREVEEPLLATTMRNLRELIADTSWGFGAASGIFSLFMWASKFGSKRSKKR